MGKKAEYGYAVTWKDKTVYYDSEEKWKLGDTRLVEKKGF